MDEMKKAGGGMETTTLAEVPMEERKSWIDVAMIQAGIMICVPSLMLGECSSRRCPLKTLSYLA